MSRRRPALAGGCLLLALAGCESSQEQSARLAKQATGAIEDRAHLVDKQSSAVKIVSRTVLRSDDRAAAVVEVRNVTGRALAQLPIAVRVFGKGNRRLFTNELPGLQASLTQVPLIQASRSFVWVNDQLSLSAPARRVEAVVGAAAIRSVPARLPAITVTNPRLGVDPISGVQVKAKVTNKSKVRQVNLVVYGVARRRGKVVAAGRAIVPRLGPGRSAPMTMFFVGNPRGAKLELSAPPSVLS